MIEKMGTMLGKGGKSEALIRFSNKWKIHEKQNSEKIAEALKKLEWVRRYQFQLYVFTGSLHGLGRVRCCPESELEEKDVERWLSKFYQRRGGERYF